MSRTGTAKLFYPPVVHEVRSDRKVKTAGCWARVRRRRRHTRARVTEPRIGRNRSALPPWNVRSLPALPFSVAGGTMLSRRQLVQRFAGSAPEVSRPFWLRPPTMPSSVPTCRRTSPRALGRKRSSTRFPARSRSSNSPTGRPTTRRWPATWTACSRRTTHSSCVIISPTSPWSTSGAGNCGSAGRRSARPSS